MKIQNLKFLRAAFIVVGASFFAAFIILNKLNSVVKVDTSDALCGGQPGSCSAVKAGSPCQDWRAVTESKGGCCSNGSFCSAGKTENCSKGEYCIATLNEEKCIDTSSVDYNKHCFNFVDIGCKPSKRCEPNPTHTPRPTPTPTRTATSTPIVTQTPTSTPTQTGTPTGTPTTTPTYTPTVTETPYPSGTPNYCGGTCGSNYNCQGGLYCYNGYCRNPDCPASNTCGCATPPPVLGITAPPSLPKTGGELPTAVFGMFSIAGIGFWIFKKFRLV